MIEERVGPFTGIYRRTDAAEKALSGVGKSGPVLTVEDKTVLHEVDGIRSVQDVVESTPYSEFDTSRVLYELIGRSMVEKAAPVASGAPAPRAAPRTAAPAQPRVRTESLPFLTIVLALVAAGSILTASHNPLNGLAVLRFGDPISASLLRQTSLSRMERIRYALQVYFLQNKGFPKDLNYLVLGGLLRSADLKDPWGSEYLYRPLVGGFEIQGKDRSGVVDPTLSLRSVPSLQ
jgi:hypothetical protein